MNKFKKAQSVLESVLAYAAATALLGAAVGIWAWGNAHVPVRQATYETTRVAAGTSSRSVSASGASGGANQALWPTYIAAPCP
ncbi:MAG: hypothetical protein PHU64_02220 [Candidatus Omnitrophica bacterium]|nr:hypothetical protein [Candidatus Omnitrophota bacterium]MDD5429891.1 hypothetical protein [Candidatus Omnitrophota bacterium]